MIKVVPVINHKGGVGKTTTAVNLGAGLARQGRRVLIVDLDAQGSASLSLGVDRDELGSAAALYRQGPLGGTARPTGIPNLFVSPGTMALADADVRLAAVPNRVGRLRQAIASVRDSYDVILLDCSPSASLLTVNALVAADGLIVPLTPDYLAVQGLVRFGDLIRRVRQAIGRLAPVLGIALTNADTGTELGSAVAETLHERFGGKVFDTIIRPDEALREAPAHAQDIFSFAPDSAGAADYGALTAEVAGRIDRYSSVFRGPATKFVTNEQAAVVERVAELQEAA